MNYHHWDGDPDTLETSGKPTRIVAPMEVRYAVAKYLEAHPERFSLIPPPGAAEKKCEYADGWSDEAMLNALVAEGIVDPKYTVALVIAARKLVYGTTLRGVKNAEARERNSEGLVALEARVARLEATLDFLTRKDSPA